MEERELKIYSVFLASSNELKDDRKEFAAFISRLNDHYNSRGCMIILKVWEFLDPAYHNKRKQDEYNDVIRRCDLFVALFYTKAGKYTIEELRVARNECEIRQLPLFIYFRDLDYWQELQKKDENLEAIKKYIGDDMQHFWGTYNTNDKLHLDFVLWLDSYLFDGKSPIKVENGRVMLEDVKVANMSQLPFAANNNEYQRLNEQLAEFNKDIEQLRQDVQEYPENEKFSARLSQKVIACEKLLQEVQRQEEALLGAAKRIAELRRQQVSEKLAKAAEAFENGQLDVANTYLDELQQEGDQLYEDVESKHEQMHDHIEALRLQTQTMMADTNIPIEERITQIEAIYEKADKWATSSNYDEKEYAKLLFNYAQFLYKYARYPKAVEIYLRQIDLSEKLYGKDSTDTATSNNNIGLVYHYKGDNDLALGFHKKALVIRKRVLGKDHSDTASSYNNIGLVYKTKGDYNRALKYYKKALDIIKKIQGEEQQYTAKLYNNIGMVYYYVSEYDLALEYQKKALDIRERVLGNDHPETATSYNNIGLVYHGKGDYDQALEYLTKALDIYKRVLGGNHQNTANSYNNIGLVYYGKGDYDQALEYFKKALDIRERVLGKDHPDTAGSYNNIGKAYYSKGDYNRALEYLTKALDIYERILSCDHPLAATFYNNIGGVYREQGDYDKALECYEKAYAIRKHKLGEGHPDTKDVKKSIEIVKKKMVGQ